MRSLLGVLGRAFGALSRREASEHQRTEEALREERFRSLAQHGSEIVTILEADGTIRYESSAIERVLGYKPSANAAETCWKSSGWT